MTFPDAMHRMSQAANALLALSLLFALVHFRWSVELFAAGCAVHALIALGDALHLGTPEPKSASSLA